MKWESIGTRAVVGIALLMFVLTATLLFTYARIETQHTIELEAQSARNLLLAAESFRENIAAKWRENVFSPDLLKDFNTALQPGESRQRILSSVPIVSAWTAINAQADEGKFQFRTPRLHARNPANEPDAVESRALEFFASNRDAKEYLEIDRHANSVRYFRPVRLTEECLVCHGAPATSAKLWDNDQGLDILGYPMENKQVGDLHGAFEIVKSLDLADAELRQHILFTGGTLLITMLVVCAVAFYLIKNNIVDRFTALGLRMQAMAQGDGDLTKRLKIEGKTEVAWLSASFNKFMGKVQKTITDINASGHRIVQQSDTLSQVTCRLQSGVRVQREETLKAANAVAALHDSASEVADHAAIAADAAKAADREAKEGYRMVQEVQDAIDQLASEVRRGAEVIGELNEFSNNIGSVVDIIRSIADQTNLLALNAAIEAARAGDQGRGFAVVADEVRVLAGRTRNSTQQIQDTILRLQEQARKAMNVMQEGQRQAQLSVGKAADAGDKLAGIATTVNTISEKNAHIAEVAHEQSRTTEAINQSIRSIGERVSESSVEAERTGEASRLLEQLADDLKAAISYFKT